MRAGSRQHCSCPPTHTHINCLVAAAAAAVSVSVSVQGVRALNAVGASWSALDEVQKELVKTRLQAVL